MINLLEEIEKLMKETPLPYERKPVLMDYRKDGFYQQIAIPCSPRSIITIEMYQDGVQINCYAYENNQWWDYQLGHVLYLRTPKGLKVIEIPKNIDSLSLDERRMYGIKYTYNMLLQFGDDVLKGGLEWTKEYPYEPFRAGDITYFLEKNNITF